jgi:hypothetical protein
MALTARVPSGWGRRLLAGLFLCLVANVAMAANPHWMNSYTWGGYQNEYFDDGQIACERKFQVEKEIRYGVPYTNVGYNGYANCYGTASNGNTMMYWSYPIYSEYQCSYTDENGVCTETAPPPPPIDCNEFLDLDIFAATDEGEYVAWAGCQLKRESKLYRIEIGGGNPQGGIPYSFTGESAAAEPVIEPETEPDLDTNCVSSSDGNTACWKPLGQNVGTVNDVPYFASQAENCGTLNGEYVCARTADNVAKNVARMPYDASCSQIINGALCETGAVSTPTDIAGNPMTKDSQITIKAPVPGGETAGANGDGTSSYHFYPNGQGSTDAADGQAELSSPSGTQMTPEAIGNEVAEGLTDSATMPEFVGDEFNSEFDGTGVQELLDGIGSEESFTPTTIGVEDLGIPEASSCQSLTITFFGRSIEIMGTEGCARMEQLKKMISFAIYAWMVISLFSIATTVRVK